MKNKPLKQAHTANTKFGMGDNYGTGIRQKVGRIRDDYSVEKSVISNKKLGTPPKSVV
jgi:hypothetical protein